MKWYSYSGYSEKRVCQGMVCADRIVGKTTPLIDYASFPRCIYCQPQVASSIGLTEIQAREAGQDVRAGEFPFSPKAVMETTLNAFGKSIHI